MKNTAEHLPELNPVLRLISRIKKSNAADSYRKGWQQAQQELEQFMHQQPIGRQYLAEVI